MLFRSQLVTDAAKDEFVDAYFVLIFVSDEPKRNLHDTTIIISPHIAPPIHIGMSVGDYHFMPRKQLVSTIAEASSYQLCNVVLSVPGMFIVINDHRHSMDISRT
jgi:hypothetical protein